jgi:hypothetical protein
VPYQTHWKPSPNTGILSVTASVADVAMLVGADPQAIFSPIADLADLGAHGGLSFAGHDPATALAKVISSRIVGGDVEWVLEIAGVASRALGLVEGAMAFFDAKLAALAKVAVTVPADLLRRRNSDEGGYHQPLPFALTDERQHQGRAYNIELQFSAAQPPEIFDRIEEAFWSWFSAASCGCFSDATYPPELSHIYLDLDDIRYHPNYAIIPIEEALLAEPDSTASLVNVFQWVHRHVVPLASVDFYD